MTRHERIPVDTAEKVDAGRTPAVDLGVLGSLAGFMLRLAQIQVFEAFFRDLGGEGTTPGQIGILVAIERNPDIRQGVLADALRVKWSNMAKTIGLLARKGLIVRRVSASDRRTVELRLAPKGSALLRLVLPKAVASDAGALAPLTGREQGTLLRLLAKLTQGQERP